MNRKRTYQSVSLVVNLDGITVIGLRHGMSPFFPMHAHLGELATYRAMVGRQKLMQAHPQLPT